MIEICGVTEAKKAVFEAVRVEQHEFLNVSCPEISVMYGISIKKLLIMNTLIHCRTKFDFLHLCILTAHEQVG